VSNTNKVRSASVPALGGEQSLNRYLTEIKKFPVLTAEQEYMLAKRYAEHEDPEAAAQLVTSHLRLVAKIATDLGVPEQEVINMNRRMMMGGDASLNVSLRGDEEGAGQWQDWLTDDRPLQDETVADAEEATVRHEMLTEAMESLNERERHILTERRLTDNPQTLEELSQVYDVSRERIRQIEVRAFEKVQKAMQRIAGERLLPAA
jgi:DNA-directed RNA polymerase sigma subunit (sigma70/sigma32)